VEVLVERGSTKHGRQLDEALKHETAGLVSGGHATHAEEWRDPEPAGEDQAVTTALVGGTPAGLAPEEVEARSELARYLGLACFPGTAMLLLEAAASNSAPETILNQLRTLPTDAEFENVAEVWQGLGGGLEERT
jgi:hypothetical protein